MGSPHRGHRGRPAESTDSACFENAMTWSWLSQKRTLGASPAGGSSVPVVSPFDGHLMAVDAVDGERLMRHQRVAWLRAA